MQRLVDPPRQDLTDAQVRTVLHCDALTVAAGLELLEPDLSVREDISDDLVDGLVERVMAATHHGTCSLTLTRQLDWGTALVRPYRILTDLVTGTSARFNVGVYCLTTPQEVAGEQPRVYAGVEGYDRMYLLDRIVGDTYVVPAGTEVLMAVRAVITAAGLAGVLLDGTAQDTVLASDMVWPLFPTGTDGRQDQPGSTTWLRIVNDLLAVINYRGLWADENGLFRSGPYVEPSQRGIEYSFDADDARTGLVGEDRSRQEDQWKVPNRWLFVWRNRPGDPPPAPVAGDGLYEWVNTDDGPASVAGRNGLVLTAPVLELDATDQASLVAQGDRIIADDRRVPVTLTITTAPFPLAGHADVLTYTDSELGGTVKVQASHWRQPLLDQDMDWELEVVATP